jgi:2,4-dienoyl-CoA reductase-like NADH-dependent reductase (Old Yellow Enzyme family)
MNKYPNVFSPIKLGDLILRNRILQSPIGAPDLTPEGLLTLDIIAFFESRAIGEEAVVTIGESVIHIKTSLSCSRHLNVILLDALEVYPSLGRAVRAIKRHGAIPSIELHHSGKHGGLGKSEADPRVRFGPSHETTQDWQEVLEMPEEMIPEMVDAYGQAAAKLKGAGFEMLVIHGGYGWLLHRFISPLDNKRKDKYSGSLENRARVPLMVIDAVRKAICPGFPIIYRMRGDEFREGGYKLVCGIKFYRLIDGKIQRKCRPYSPYPWTHSRRLPAAALLIYY